MPRAPDIVAIDSAEPGALGTYDLSDHLEHGRIVHFPQPPLPLPPPEDLAFLKDELPSLILLKNISYYPQAKRTVGMKGSKETREKTTRILVGYHARVEEFLRRVIPSLAKNWIPGTASYRPIEEQGRDLSSHASNERIHVDAKAYGATHGGRILRFFTNLHPSKPRVWRVKGTFADLYDEFGHAAGLHRGTGPAIPAGEGLIDRFYSRIIRALGAVAPMVRSLDTSPYDRAMRRLHNYMKDNEDFQNGRDGERIVEFGPMSSWMVFTDHVGHSCISGRFALVHTFLIPLENCRLASQTPYALLRSGTAPR